MAVSLQGTLVAPSTDYRSLNELDSVSIEAGLYYCDESRTITAGGISFTSDSWAVTCISSEERDTLHCFAQIWIPTAAGVGTDVTAFIRYAAPSAVAFGSYRAILNDQHAVKTDSASDVRIILSSTQPQPIQNATIIWLDTTQQN